ncbi:zinc finger protein 260-like isoform X1 [Micropterus dolomieu]|uniref:zinc finger protein 260-like isoform X1 n=1 Tax=Micropterus dolomieu TaxID=147949 RepID=UPI001E8D103F|nr:zinc finger protein 260-like isoform X1 [Micropterus dolomieu]XP_045886658.1 zinc finger protein 260-like isoform X1 [Micropterus dolomieu]
MSDYLTREFQAQLTTTMDSVLRRTMSEIMKIFENSLHDHQMALAQKGEEIVQLKIKLQTAEIKLRGSECGGDRGAEMNISKINEMHRDPEDVLNAIGQTSDVPEIDFEVPDDWCAPLGSETVNKQEEGVCPSIRLRPLSIALWHIPNIKQEVVNRDIDSHQRAKGCRRSKRGSSLNQGHKHTQDRSLAKCDRGPTKTVIRNDMKKLLLDIKQEYTDRSEGLKGRGRHLRKAQQNTLKSKGDQRNIAVAESKSAERETVKSNHKKRYSCKFCEKVFDTEFGRSVHVRSHKRCRGCKKEFPFPSALKNHKPYCGKLKKLLTKIAQSADPLKPQSSEESTSPSKKQVIKEDSTPSSSNHSQSSVQKDGYTKKHSCVHCNKKFNSICKCRDHMRVHTGEKPFPCDLCPKKFRVNQSLKVHLTRMHQDKSSSETNGGLAWTEPLEEIEDDQEDLISSSKDTRQAIDVQSEHNPDKKPSRQWQTMGTRCSNGFSCLLCPKIVRNKYMLTEHFRTHTGERPIKCDRCPAKFHSNWQLSVHKKGGCNPLIQCEKCEKNFFSQTRYNKHVSKYHKDWSIFCKFCGRGFVVAGRLRNHMERCHK